MASQNIRPMSFSTALGGVFAVALMLLGSCSPKDDVPKPPPVNLKYTEERAPCSDRNPDKNAYFGDLHVHTYLSFDARAYGNLLTPADAYRFAKGEEVPLPPQTAGGESSRTAQLERPLDFLAVTDHAELLGEVYRCSTETSPVYNEADCVAYRDPEGRGAFNFGLFMSDPQPKRSKTICGEDGMGCQVDARKRWQECRRPPRRPTIAPQPVDSPPLSATSTPTRVKSLTSTAT